MDFYENDEVVDLWTSEFLKGFNSGQPRATTASKPHVAFGRTTHQQEAQKAQSRPRTVPSNAFAERSKERMSLHRPTNLSMTRNQQTKVHLTKISGQQSKVRGTQMLNFRIDLSKAREKRQRQLQYSREIRSGAKCPHTREIDSIRRIVVQSFRKLIDCERCALFLMDESTNELYFKPVGEDHSHARVKEVRFPASSGVAGWVATTRTMVNIQNAYTDSRFNSEIDKRTGFRTRTILCHPVLSSTNQLLGVIQMVNKKKGDAKELRDRAKKKKSGRNKGGHRHAGYDSAYEYFSVEDEQTLGKCCAEVAKSLEEIFAQRDRQSKAADGSDQVVVVSDEEGITPLKGNHVGRPKQIVRDEASNDQSTTETESYAPEPPPRRRHSSLRRRSSVGLLASFVKRNSIDGCLDHDEGRPIGGKGITEALQKFEFRTRDSKILQQREEERRQCDPEYLVAQEKRKRMTTYALQKG